MPRDRSQSSLDVPLWRIAQHFGLPTGRADLEPWRALIEATRRWCHDHMQPWRGSRQLSIARLSRDKVMLETGQLLTSRRLAEKLSAERAWGLAVLALSAGHSVDDEIRRLWEAGHPDGAMSLHAFAVGWVEECRAREASRLQRMLAPHGLRVLPYLSPGYEGWPLSDQANLFAVVAPVAGPIELLDSNFLRPARSTIAAFGLAPVSAADAGVFRCRARSS